MCVACEESQYFLVYIWMDFFRCCSKQFGTSTKVLTLRIKCNEKKSVKWFEQNSIHLFRSWTNSWMRSISEYEIQANTKYRITVRYEITIQLNVNQKSKKCQQCMHCCSNLVQRSGTLTFLGIKRKPLLDYGWTGHQNIESKREWMSSVNLFNQTFPAGQMYSLIRRNLDGKSLIESFWKSHSLLYTMVIGNENLQCTRKAAQLNLSFKFVCFF